MSAREFVVKHFDKEYEELSLEERCRAPVSAISGISEPDAADLKEAFGIDTVEEPATNKYVFLPQGLTPFPNTLERYWTKSSRQLSSRRINHSQAVWAQRNACEYNSIDPRYLKLPKHPLEKRTMQRSKSRTEGSTPWL